MKKKTTQDLVSEKPSSLAAFKKQKRNPIFIILSNIRSLQNVGLVFRVCDAVKAERLYLTGFTGYPPLAKGDLRREGVKIHAANQIEKTAIRTIEYQPWEYKEDSVKVIKNLKKQGCQIVAVEQTWQSIDYRNAPYKFPIALIFGHEREGIDAPVLKLADFAVEIPMLGMGNSLNVAMAVTVLGYHLVSVLGASTKV